MKLEGGGWGEKDSKRIREGKRGRVKEELSCPVTLVQATLGPHKGDPSSSQGLHRVTLALG